MARLIDLTGMRFGRLTVVSRSDNRGKQPCWKCVCDCGTEKIVQGNSLRSGAIQSCGCLHREVTGSINRTHGYTGTRLYMTWQNMRARCYRKSAKRYDDYGGRGITVCDEWRVSFEAFRDWALQSGYSDELTIDRIDVNGNYEPGNCRWISNNEQQFNRRNNRNITFNGKTQTISQWAKEYGLECKTLQGRLDKSGWSIEKALTTPVDNTKIHRKGE